MRLLVHSRSTPWQVSDVQIAQASETKLDQGFCMSNHNNQFVCTGLIVPELLPNGQVKVDMGQPILEGPKIPTTLAPTQGSTVLEQVSRIMSRVVDHAQWQPLTAATTSNRELSEQAAWPDWAATYSLTLSPQFALQEVNVDGQHIKFTCISMGNPHAVAYTMNGKPVKVSMREAMGRAGVQCQQQVPCCPGIALCLHLASCASSSTCHIIMSPGKLDDVQIAIIRDFTNTPCGLYSYTDSCQA
jgi:hypothetical protein